MESLKEAYGDDMRFVYRHLPLISVRNREELMNRAIEAAEEEGKSTEMQEILFSRQAEWASRPAVTIIDTLVGYAEEISLEDVEQFETSLRQVELDVFHDKALVAAEAAEAAGAQDKFWEMHDILFERQPNWSSLPPEDMIDLLVEYAEEIELDDVDQFRAELENDTYVDKVLADYEAAISANIASTPSFVINQVDYPAQSFGLSFEGLDAFMTLMKLRNSWFEQPEQVIDPDKEYTATIETEQGDIVIELFPDTAPVNVNSFVFLAQQDWYKDGTFHRVLPGFVAQGGDPTGTGIGFPGYRCGDEITPGRTFDQAGLVSLANSGPNTNGSQFFITYGPTPNLNSGFTIIGQVIEGMEVAENLTPRDPQQNPDAAPGDQIIDITIAEK